MRLFRYQLELYKYLFSISTDKIIFIGYYKNMSNESESIDEVNYLLTYTIKVFCLLAKGRKKTGCSYT